MTRRAVWPVLVAVSVLAAVFAAAHQSAGPRSGPLGPVALEATPVPLNPADASQEAVGDFRYAGGLAITASDTDRVHGLSDLDVAGADRLVAVSDLGAVLEGRLRFDREARLVGVSDVAVGSFTGTTGEPLFDKVDVDAEGVALLGSGDRLVSFELRDRIWLYPAAGGSPTVVPSPPGPFAFNLGMEALAADPDAGPDAYVVGIESTGQTWSCRLSRPTCQPGPTIEKSPMDGLVAMRRLPHGMTAYLLRGFDVLRGNRISLVIRRAAGDVARLELAPPLSVDNFEGLAAVPRTDGGIRFYLVSDDNGLPRQRTLLFAFDWWPR